MSVSAARQTVLDQLAPWGKVLTEDATPLTGVMRMDGHLHSLQKNLLKMRRPNALIIGQPGTGKTALVLEFARLAGGLDDPGQHELLEHPVLATGPVQPQHPVAGLQCLPQPLGLGRQDRQLRSVRPPVPEVEADLACVQPLHRDRLWQLQLNLVMGRADVLNLPRPTMVGVNDLNRGSAA